MNVIPIETDLAALAVFDPEVLLRRVRESRDWWQRQPQHVINEVAEGQIGIFAIGRHGRYRLALRVNEGLNAEEEPYAVAQAEGYGLSVVSGKAFVGAAERLPCEGRGKVIAVIPDTGLLLDVPEGCYALIVHVLHWREEDCFYDEDNEVLPEAPADFVVELRSVPARLEVRASPLPLLDLIPKKETRGEARVRFQPQRRRASSPETTRRRRGGSASAAPSNRGGSGPRPPRHVESRVAPYQGDEVRAAFREVLTERSLHPSDGLHEILRMDMTPFERKNLANDVDMHGLLKKATRVRENIRVFEAKVNSRLEPYAAVAVHGAINGVYRSLGDLLDFLAEEAPGSVAEE